MVELLLTLGVFVCLWLYRIDMVYYVCCTFQHDDKLMVLPKYETMLYSPKHWNKWTLKQWQRWAAYQAVPQR